MGLVTQVFERAGEALVGIPPAWVLLIGLLMCGVLVAAAIAGWPDETERDRYDA